MTEQIVYDKTLVEELVNELVAEKIKNFEHRAKIKEMAEVISKLTVHAKELETQLLAYHVRDARPGL